MTTTEPMPGPLAIAAEQSHQKTYPDHGLEWMHGSAKQVRRIAALAHLEELHDLATTGELVRISNHGELLAKRQPFTSTSRVTLTMVWAQGVEPDVPLIDALEWMHGNFERSEWNLHLGIMQAVTTYGVAAIYELVDES